MDEFCTNCGKLIDNDDIHFDYVTNERVYLYNKCWDEKLFILLEELNE